MDFKSACIVMLVPMLRRQSAFEEGAFTEGAPVILLDAYFRR
jgi:hypothetical protein